MTWDDLTNCRLSGETACMCAGTVRAMYWDLGRLLACFIVVGDCVLATLVLAGSISHHYTTLLEHLRL